LPAIDSLFDIYAELFLKALTWTTVAKI